MGAVAAVRILHRRRLAEVPEDVRGEVEAELAAEHEKLAGGLARAQSRSASSTRSSSRRRTRVRALAAGHRRGPAVRGDSTATSRCRRVDHVRQLSRRGCSCTRRPAWSLLVPRVARQVRRPGAASGRGRRRRRSGTARARRPRPCRAQVAARCAVVAGSRGRARARRAAGPRGPGCRRARRCGVEDARARACGTSAPLGAGAGLLGDLEAQVHPVAQRGGQPRRRCPRRPARTARRARCRARRAGRPVEGHAHAEHTADRPLDVRAQRRRCGMDEDNATGSPPECLLLDARCVFPSGLARRAVLAPGWYSAPAITR